MPPSADIFAMPGPRWFSIPSGRSFLDDTARGLMMALGDRLSEAQVLTPTRRGARAMARAFSDRAKGGALLLPQIRAIGDLDDGEPPFDLETFGLDLPPALSPIRRRFELARLIADHADLFTATAMTTRRALDLADSLGAFFDSLALEEVDAAGRLDSLVAGEGNDQYVLDSWASHWRISARFLSLAVHAWPERLSELGLMDPNVRQVELLRRLIHQWTDSPPETALVLAGSTGSAPAMADLMKAVAECPRGAVILPGLDLSLADDAWAQIEDSHPQGTMKRLLDRHKLNRDIVSEWPASHDSDRGARARRRLLNEALRPAEATKDWREQIQNLRNEGETGDSIADGLAGLNHITVARDEEAAAVIALLMRETLDTPGRIAALVTPDQALARRVSARLTRWGLQADSSAGEPLANSLPGRFLLDLVTLFEIPDDPVALLSLLRNPLCRFNDARGLRELEMRALRGARRDVAAMAAVLADLPDALHLWTDYLAAVAPLAGLAGSLSDAITRIAAAAEALSRGDALWRGAPGAQAAELLAGLIEEGAGFAVAGMGEAGAVLVQALRQAKVRTGGNTHPRLLVLGAIEARLVAADRLILAGLEEGVWPPAPALDPFLSRPMRQRLGLPSPERRTGLSAHDFVQAACAPEVFLIHRQRREGEPQVASRWLWRLQTLAEGAGLALPADERWLAWARALDRGLDDRPAALRPAPRPEPKPPLAVRPDRLSVTEVETFIRDPYAIYARKILRLRPLDRPNEPVEARQRGTAIHAALEGFVADGVTLDNDGAGQLAARLEGALATAGLPPPLLALQRPLLPGMAADYIAFDAARRADLPRLVIEQRGELKIATSRGDFTLIAKADRIELRDGVADVIDYKTGAPPSAKAVIAGFYPQLTLTAAMLKRGVFPGIAACDIGDLLYVKVSAGGSEEKHIRDKDLTGDDLADTALARLHGRLEAFGDATKGYVSWAAPQFARGRGGDFDHLARLYEWDVLGDDEPAESEAS